jgi:hypothetical protein
MGECPTNFVPYQGACVRQCPPNVFSFVMDNNQPRCVLKSDNTKRVNLTPVTSVPREPGQAVPTLENLRQSDPSRYALFKTESDRVDSELNIIESQLDLQNERENAFRQLQAAENVRDQSPEAYQQARTTYYSMTEGPEWIEREKERIAKVDVDPLVNNYRTSYSSITSRQQQQQRTQDIMNSVKEGVLTLKDDFQYTTQIFKDQIDNLKNQINIERRGREKPQTEDTEFYKWLDALLNLFIIAGLLYAVFVFWRKLGKSPAPAYAPAVISTQ